jgi:6-phosphofructokinase 1
MVDERKFGCMVALVPPNLKAVPLEEVIGRTKNVPLDSDVIQTGRDIGICFGD